MNQLPRLILPLCALLALTQGCMVGAKYTRQEPAGQAVEPTATPIGKDTVTPEKTPSAQVNDNPRDTKVGAIRWDAWIGDAPSFGDSTSENRVGLVVERTLGPAHWHYRLPFFAEVVSEQQVRARGATQEIMDQEIGYAVQAGLDYWAFVFYKPGSGLDAGRNLYLSSSRRGEINFCLIIDSGSHLADSETRALFIKYIQMAEYQTVLDGRPLFYIFGGNGLSQDLVNTFKQETEEAGMPAPYLVYMGWNSTEVSLAIKNFGLDAGSSYAQLGSNGAPFAQMARHGEIAWGTYMKAGIPVVPWVTTGWDPRPRVENPTPWVTYQATQWAETAKPEEIADHLKKALAFTSLHPDEIPANAVIIYAWNEFDEGGWLCPTLENGTDRIDAVGSILK